MTEKKVIGGVKYSKIHIIIGMDLTKIKKIIQIIKVNRYKTWYTFIYNIKYII